MRRNKKFKRFCFQLQLEGEEVLNQSPGVDPTALSGLKLIKKIDRARDPDPVDYFLG